MGENFRPTVKKHCEHPVQQQVSMNIIIISTLEGVAWGGSEELWMQTALAAAAGGHAVAVSMMGAHREHPKLERLRQSGVEVVFAGLPSYRVDPVLKRVYRKLSRNTGIPVMKNRFSWIEDSKPDIILVNASTAISLTHFPDLLEWMIATKLPFHTLLQHHFENGVLTDWQKKGLLAVFGKAQKNHIVAWRNAEVLERQLAAVMPRKNLVLNPVSVTQQVLIPFPAWDILKIAVVARLDCVCKGQDILLEALATFTTEKPFHITFYGDGPDRPYLQDLISFYHLGHVVNFAGHVKGMDKVWADNHILLLPSISEGTPISLVEAMLCGRAAIVTDVGDNARLVTNHKNGYVVPAPTVACLQRTLAEAIADYKSWEMMGQAALGAVSTFGEKNVALSFLDKLTT